MFFAANHYTGIKVLKLVESAMKSAMTVQVGVTKGIIDSCHFYDLLDNIADETTRQIIKEKSLLRCEPSVN